MPSSQQPLTRFVVLEGLDGAGTTTQAALVTDALRGRDLRVCATAEPSDGPVGRVLRAHLTGELTLDPQTAALTFTADRADHLARVIRPALARGEWVVCDRYLLSTLAYQGAEGVDRDVVLRASEGFDVPDLTVFLEVPTAQLAARLAERPRVERYEASGLAEALASSYRTSIEALRGLGHRIEVVDGTEPPEVVLQGVLTRLDAVS